jgi:hypothetical protein
VLTVLLDTFKQADEGPFKKATAGARRELRPHVRAYLDAGAATVRFDAPGDPLVDGQGNPVPPVPGVGGLPGHHRRRLDFGDHAHGFARDPGDLLPDPDPSADLDSPVIEALEAFVLGIRCRPPALDIAHHLPDLRRGRVDQDRLGELKHGRAGT